MSTSKAPSASETISSHISAGVSVIVGVIALVHPGFSEPGWVGGAVGAVGVVMAALIEISHVVTKRNLLSELAYLSQEALHGVEGEVESLANSAKSTSGTSTTPSKASSTPKKTAKTSASTSAKATTTGTSTTTKATASK